MSPGFRGVGLLNCHAAVSAGGQHGQTLVAAVLTLAGLADPSGGVALLVETREELWFSVTVRRRYSPGFSGMIAMR